jgi:hypothetical protein
MAVLLDAEAGSAGVTYAVKLTESDTSGGTYTDVTGGAFTTTCREHCLAAEDLRQRHLAEALRQGLCDRGWWYWRWCRGSDRLGFCEVQLMALTEDLDIFLADFGVSCTAGAVTANGILDMPSQVLGERHGA